MIGSLGCDSPAVGLMAPASSADAGLRRGSRRARVSGRCGPRHACPHGLCFRFYLDRWLDLPVFMRVTFFRPEHDGRRRKAERQPLPFREAFQAA